MRCRQRGMKQRFKVESNVKLHLQGIILAVLCGSETILDLGDLIEEGNLGTVMEMRSELGS